MTWKRSFLVVANVTATSEQLLDELKARAAEQPSSFTLVIPATPFGGGREAASGTLGEALEELQGRGARVRGQRRQRRPDRGGHRRLGSEAVRRDHRLHAADAVLEMAARGPARADREAHRCARHARGLGAAQARTGGRAASGAPGPRHGAAVGAGLGGSQAEPLTLSPRSPAIIRPMSVNLGSILTAMVTPFDADGRVDEEAAVRLMHHLVEHGSDGLVVCGTTGEASTLTDEEHLGMIRLAVEEMRGRVHDRRRRRLERHPPRGPADRAGDRARPRRAAVRQPVLQPSQPARDRPSLPGGLPRHRPADPALQHPPADGIGHVQRPAGRARAARQHRRRQAGQRRQPGQDRRPADLRRQRRPARRRARSRRAGRHARRAATCSARRCTGWSTSPSAAARSTRASRTSTATWRSRRWPAPRRRR